MPYHKSYQPKNLRSLDCFCIQLGFDMTKRKKSKEKKISLRVIEQK
jgi:hypothetical protein